jgi:hypothetical protein
MDAAQTTGVAECGNYDRREEEESERLPRRGGLLVRIGAAFGLVDGALGSGRLLLQLVRVGRLAVRVPNGGVS